MTNATALVTGASSGIGKEIARQLAAAGLTVYVGSRTVERGQRAVEEIAGNVRLLVVDVTDAASVAGAAGQVEDLNVLVNNAGVMIDGRAAIEGDVDSFRASYETNVFGAAYRSSKTALNALTVYYAQALASEGFKVNALAPGLRATSLNARAAASGGDPAEAAAGAVRLALLPDDGPTGRFF